jgi:2-aminoethylphosphonate transport system ATP-binding protein
LRIAPLGAGPLHGVISSVEWYGAMVSVAVVLDALPETPLHVSLQRSAAALPQKGARVSLCYESTDVIFIKPD